MKHIKSKNIEEYFGVKLLWYKRIFILFSRLLRLNKYNKYTNTPEYLNIFFIKTLIIINIRKELK